MALERGGSGAHRAGGFKEAASFVLALISFSPLNWVITLWVVPSNFLCEGLAILVDRMAVTWLVARRNDDTRLKTSVPLEGS